MLDIKIKNGVYIRYIENLGVYVRYLPLNISLQMKVGLIYLIYLYFQLAGGNLMFQIFRELSFLFRVVFNHRLSLNFQRDIANF